MRTTPGQSRPSLLVALLLLTPGIGCAAAELAPATDDNLINVSPRQDPTPALPQGCTTSATQPVCSDLLQLGQVKFVDLGPISEIVQDPELRVLPDGRLRYVIGQLSSDSGSARGMLDQYTFAFERWSSEHDGPRLLVYRKEYDGVLLEARISAEKRPAGIFGEATLTTVHPVR